MMRFCNLESRMAEKALVLLIAGCLTACGEAVTASAPAPAPTLPELAELSPELRLQLAQPVSPEALAGRPATEEDLRMVESWFKPGELRMAIATTNRYLVATGADTVPHCLPRCPHPADARQ